MIVLVGEILCAGGKDYYKVLGVDRQADDRTLKKAYRREAMKHHPDKGGSEEKFAEIGQAYEVLTDKEKRQIYDQYGEEGLKQREGGGRRRRRRREPVRWRAPVRRFWWKRW